MFAFPKTQPVQLALLLICLAVGLTNCEKEDFSPTSPDPGSPADTTQMNPVDTTGNQNPVDTTGNQTPVDTTEDEAPVLSSFSTPLVQLTSDFTSAELSITSNRELDFGYAPVGPNGANYYHESTQGAPAEFEGIARWKNLGRAANTFPAATTDSPANRPAYIREATPNGRPALEFVNFSESNSQYDFECNTYLRMDNRFLQGESFTLFAVVSIPEEQYAYYEAGNAIFENERAQLISSEDGSQEIFWTPWTDFTIDFPNEQFKISSTKNYEDKYQDVFEVIAIRFSQKDGLTYFENGARHLEKPGDADFRDNSGMPSIVYLGSPQSSVPSLLRIAELRIYEEAGTDAAIRNVTEELRNIYGL